MESFFYSGETVEKERAVLPKERILRKVKKSKSFPEGQVSPAQRTGKTWNSYGSFPHPLALPSYSDRDGVIFASSLELYHEKSRQKSGNHGIVWVGNAI